MHYQVEPVVRYDFKWGNCKGSVVYQHNLRINLRGPSLLDTDFEVIIDKGTSMTCVEALSRNGTRALVDLIAGGPGYNIAKLKFRGYENEGMSYLVRVNGLVVEDDEESDYS